MGAPPDRREELLEELVFQVLERCESGEAGVVEELCRLHPEQSGELRRRIDSLRASGLAASATGAPSRLGEFELVRRLGQGGMGVVYVAHQPSLARRVALKLVRPEQLFFAGARERFQREVEAVARLAHPGIVPVFSVGEQDGLPYYAMELIEGVSLDEVIARLRDDILESSSGVKAALSGREIARLGGANLREAIVSLCRERGFDAPERGPEGLPLEGAWPDVCAWIVREIAQALEHAHQRGVLHRDVKPSNVLVTPMGRVMLVDFGLASTAGSERITGQGAQLGSLAYMSPEALAGNVVVDVRSDVFGLGATYFELLTLRLPFEGASSEQLRLRQSPPSPRRLVPVLGADVEIVVSSALAPEPERRYASAADFARDLSNLLARRPVAARAIGPWLALRRWSQRRPAAATAAALGLVVAIAAPWAYGVQEAKARQQIEHERNLAESARIRAENAEALAKDEREAARRAEELATKSGDLARSNLAAALDAIEDLLARVGHRDLRDVPRVDPLRRELLERAIELYGRLERDAPDDAEVRLRSASALGKIARLRRETGDPTGALRDFELALERFEALHGERPDDWRVACEFGNLLAFATAARVQLTPTQALAELRRALELLRNAVALAPAERRPRADLARVQLAAAHYLDIGGDSAAALSLWAECLALTERLRSEDPSDRDALESWVTATGRVATFDGLQGRPHEARAGYERLIRESDGVSDASNYLRLTRALAVQSLARLFDRNDALEGAGEVDRLHEQASAELRALSEDFPRNVQYAASYTVSLFNRFDCAFAAGELQLAERLGEESLATAQRAESLSPQDPERIRAVAYAHERLHDVCVALRDLEVALGHARASAQIHLRAVNAGQSASRSEHVRLVQAWGMRASAVADPRELLAAGLALARAAAWSIDPPGCALDAARALQFAERIAQLSEDLALAARIRDECRALLEDALANHSTLAPRVLELLQAWGDPPPSELAPLLQLLSPANER